MPRRTRDPRNEEEIINDLINDSKTVSLKIKKYYQTRYRKTYEIVKLKDLKDFIEYLEPEDRFYIEDYPNGWYLNENYLNIELIFDLHNTLLMNDKWAVGRDYPKQKQIYQVKKEKIVIEI
jgi:hypothetical protein